MNHSIGALAGDGERRASRVDGHRGDGRLVFPEILDGRVDDDIAADLRHIPGDTEAALGSPRGERVIGVEAASVADRVDIGSKLVALPLAV